MKINLPVTGRNVDFAPDANILSTTDLTSAITYANPDFIKISGYSREELLGAPHNLLRHPDMPSAAFAHMWRTLKRGLDQHFVYRVKGQQVEVVPVQVVYQDSGLNIISGVQAGDVLVSDGQSRLKPGSQVQVLSDPPQVVQATEPQP